MAGEFVFQGSSFWRFFRAKRVIIQLDAALWNKFGSSGTHVKKKKGKTKGGGIYVKKALKNKGGGR